jgi:hypothetical protein
VSFFYYINHYVFTLGYKRIELILQIPCVSQSTICDVELWTTSDWFFPHFIGCWLMINTSTSSPYNTCYLSCDLNVYIVPLFRFQSFRHSSSKPKPYMPMLLAFNITALWLGPLFPLLVASWKKDRRKNLLPFCDACWRMHHRIYMGPTWGPTLHMGEGNYVAHLPTCTTEFLVGGTIEFMRPHLCGVYGNMRHRSPNFCGAYWHMRHRMCRFFLLPTQLHTPPGSPF